jgi:hypothetical protein
LTHKQLQDQIPLNNHYQRQDHSANQKEHRLPDKALAFGVELFVNASELIFGGSLLQIGPAQNAENDQREYCDHTGENHT